MRVLAMHDYARVQLASRVLLRSRTCLFVFAIRYVEDYTNTTWWRDWVLGDAYKAAATADSRKGGLVSLASAGPSKLTTSVPDTVVLNAWLWHAVYPRTNGRLTSRPLPSRQQVRAHEGAELSCIRS
jgi:hypothetical protein